MKSNLNCHSQCRSIQVTGRRTGVSIFPSPMDPQWWQNLPTLLS